MAITTYSELQTAITDYLGESALATADVKQMIQLAEARLNRKLKSVRSSASLTGTASSATIDVSSYNVIQPVALYLTTYDEDDEIVYKAPGTFPYVDTASYPTMYTLIADNDTIRFNVPLEDAYTFRFEYVGRFALSDSATTNELLTNHPDVYFAASLVWGGIRLQDAEFAAYQKALLDEFLLETGHYLSQKNRAVLTVDRAITAFTGQGGYDIESDF
jgi:hypothetical protein